MFTQAGINEVELAREEQAKQWQSENREAIDAYNRRVEAEGVFSDDLRYF
ncbi:MAG: type II toxin-antitoxin system CcdA family antitoxin [Magnetococcales bacterium]|nr:type II toxin-antitoxin system CcdA family antitoxin [Magnetococcales bacterium]